MDLILCSSQLDTAGFQRRTELESYCWHTEVDALSPFLL